MNPFSLISTLAPIFQTLVERIFPDKEKQDAANLAIQQALNQAQAESDKAYADQMASQKDVIVAETNSQSWAARNWRPYLMMMCIAIVGYNWILVGLLNALLSFAHTSIVAVAIPPELWTLVTVGLGGYIGKETISTYSQAKYGPANDKAFFDTLRQKVFKSGMTQSQVDAIEDALKARDNNG